MKEKMQHPAIGDPEGWAKACAEADKLMEPIDKRLNLLIEKTDQLVRGLTDVGYLEERG